MWSIKWYAKEFQTLHVLQIVLCFQREIWMSGVLKLLAVTYEANLICELLVWLIACILKYSTSSWLHSCYKWNMNKHKGNWIACFSFLKCDKVIERHTGFSMWTLSLMDQGGTLLMLDLFFSVNLKVHAWKGKDSSIEIFMHAGSIMSSPRPSC